jgi:biotin carboxyl carrier protein
MGLAARVHAQPGQAVAVGELLLVLEAMKMETNITAMRAGTMKAVHVAAGDAVKVNQVLLELE